MADVSEIRETSTGWQRPGEVRCGCLESQKHYYVKSMVAWCWRGEMAATVHMCIRRLFPRLRTSYRAVYRRISGGVR